MVKIGRNVPCPCGSGKKYKKCCLMSKAGKAQKKGSSTKFIPVYTQLDQLSNSVVDLIKQDRLDEAEAVLAHEVSHVANGDMVTLALIQGVVNTFVIFASRVVGHIVDRVILKNERGHGIGFFVSSMIAQVVFGILASVIVMYFSRVREFKADAGAAKLAGSEKMVAALQRLQMIHQPSRLPEQMAAFGINVDWVTASRSCL